MDNEGKCTVLSYAELVQCVGVHNLRYSWESSLDSYPLAAQCVQPTQAKKESDKVLCQRSISSSDCNPYTSLQSMSIVPIDDYSLLSELPGRFFCYDVSDLLVTIVLKF